MLGTRRGGMSSPFDKAGGGNSGRGDFNGGHDGFAFLAVPGLVLSESESLMIPNTDEPTDSSGHVQTASDGRATAVTAGFRKTRPRLPGLKTFGQVIPGEPL